MGKLRFFMVVLIVLLSSGIYMTRNFMNMATVSMVQFDNKTSLNNLLFITYNQWDHAAHFIFKVNQSTHHQTTNKSHHTLQTIDQSNSTIDFIVAYVHTLCDERFKWSTSVIARIQGAFFLGYVFLQMQSASLAEKHGGSTLVLSSVFFSSIVSLLGPFIASNEWIFIFSRFICGLAQSCFLPAAFVVLMHWLPKTERTLGVTALSTSSSIGTVLIYFASGFITTGLGWPYLFWIAGAYGLMTSIISYAFLYSKPQDHPFISQDEFLYITSDSNDGDTRRLLSSSVESVIDASIDVNANEIDQENKTKAEGDATIRKKPSVPVPWGQIFKNKSFISIFLVKVTRAFLFSYEGSFSAIFNQTIVGLSPEVNGMISASMCAVYIITAFPMTILCEQIIKNNWMNRTQLRRSSALVESCGQTICRILIPFAVMYGPTWMYLSLIVINSLFGGLGIFSEGPIAREMSKNFGHSIYAFLNVSSVLAIVVYPSVISLILELNNNSRIGWFIVHWITAGLIFVPTIPYVFWASSERQSFDMIRS